MNRIRVLLWHTRHLTLVPYFECDFNCNCKSLMFVATFINNLHGNAFTICSFLPLSQHRYFAVGGDNEIQCLWGCTLISVTVLFYVLIYKQFWICAAMCAEIFHYRIVRYAWGTIACCFKDVYCWLLPVIWFRLIPTHMSVLIKCQACYGLLCCALVFN